MSVVSGLTQLGGFTKMKLEEILEYWLIQHLDNVLSTHWSQIPRSESSGKKQELEQF